MNKELRINFKIDKDTGELKIAKKELDEFTGAVGGAKKQITDFAKTLMGFAGAYLSFAALNNTIQVFVKNGISYNSQLEQMEIGIASIVAANDKGSNATNKWSNSIGVAQTSITALKIANLQTKATLAELTTGFQSALAPALKAGLNIKQTVEYTKLMTQAAGAMNIPMNQLSQELKSVVGGTIDMNSVVATNLGITNEQIKLHTKQGDLFEFLTKKLEAFSLSGDAVSDSFDGMVSNMQDNWDTFNGEVIANSGMFNAVKASLKLFNEEFQKISKDKELLESLGSTGKVVFKGMAYGVAIIIKAFNGLGMIMHTVKTGWDKIGAILGVGISKLKIKYQELQLASMKAMNITGILNKTVAAQTLELGRLNREQIQYTKILNGADEKNSKFIKSLDKINKTAWKLATTFDETFKKQIPEKIKKVGVQSKKTADNMEKNFKGSFKGITEAHDKRLEQIKEKELKTYNKIADEYKKHIYTKEEKLQDWYNKNRTEIENNIKDEKKRNEAVEKLSIIHNDKLAIIDKNRTENQQAENKDRKDQELDNQEEIKASFSSGVKAIFASWKQNSLNMTSVSKTFANSSAAVLQTNLVDVFEGKTKNIGDFFENTFSGIKKIFIKMITEIAAKSIIMNFMNSWQSGGNTGSGFVEQFLGIDIPFLNFAEGKKPHVWSGYGIVNTPAPAPMAGNSIHNDNIWAKISRDEAVLPRTIVQQHRPLIDAMFEGNLPNYAYGKKADVIDGVPHYWGGFGGFVKSIGGAIGGLGKGVGSVLGGIGGFIGEILSPFKKILGPLMEIVAPALKPILQNPELGWLGQAGILAATVASGGALAPVLYPMLTADLISTGLTLSQGGNLGDALSGAGLSGLIAGGGVAMSSMLNPISSGMTQAGYAGMTSANQSVWTAVQSYPQHIMDSVTNKWAGMKEGWGKLTNVSDVNQEFSSNMSQSLWDTKKGNFLQIGQNIADMGKDRFDYLSNFLSSPSMIFQHIMDKLGSILGNITTSISNMSANPLVASMVSQGLINSQKPLNRENKITAFANGGYIKHPTIGLVGEAGAEIIAPEEIMRKIVKEEIKDGFEKLERKIDKLIYIMQKVVDNTGTNININKKILVAVNSGDPQ